MSRRASALPSWGHRLLGVFALFKHAIPSRRVSLAQAGRKNRTELQLYHFQGMASFKKMSLSLSALDAPNRKRPIADQRTPPPDGVPHL